MRFCFGTGDEVEVPPLGFQGFEACFLHYPSQQFAVLLCLGRDDVSFNKACLVINMGVLAEEIHLRSHIERVACSGFAERMFFGVPATTFHIFCCTLIGRVAS